MQDEKGTKKGICQAGGHEGGIAEVDDHPGCVLKTYCQTEAEALQELLLEPELLPFCPRWHGKKTVNGKDFEIISNLIHGMVSPVVMDIKMGTRTFDASLVDEKKLRPDLLEKMVKADANKATTEEREAGGITKLRYMQFREDRCTTGTMGFRIEAIHNSVDPLKCLTKDQSKDISSEVQVHEALAVFFQGREKSPAGETMLKRLQELRQVLQGSSWFLSHELIGSSILFTYDQEAAPGSAEAGVWMIDFAHTRKATGGALSHKKPWNGSSQDREDGYLVGLDKLIEIFSRVIQ